MNQRASKNQGMKKPLIIAGVIVVIAVLAFLIYDEVKVGNYQKAINAYLDERDIVLRQPMKLQSIEAVKRSVMNNLGIAYVPSFSVEEELKNGSLLQLKTGLDDHVFPAVCVYHRNKWISPQMKVAFKILSEQLGIVFPS